MIEPTLVILTAGMGSRYGGLKQLDIVGNNNENIIDFSIYDAIRAGFKNLVLIIREEHEKLFEENIGQNVHPFINLQYVYQNVKDLPAHFICPDKRVKPWGTAQALLCCKDVVDGPFAIINADDYYGPDAFKKMYDFLSDEQNKDCFAMIGYQLSATLSENGLVTRAICNIDNGSLKNIKEIQKVGKINDSLCMFDKYNNSTIINDCLCSMNFWGFTPEIFAYTQDCFEKWLEKNIDKTKAEYVIPSVIRSLLKENKIEVAVLDCNDEWFGVTYPEDKPYVCQKLIEYKEKGIYPFDLWENKK